MSARRSFILGMPNFRAMIPPVARPPIGRRGCFCSQAEAANENLASILGAFIQPITGNLFRAGESLPAEHLAQTMGVRPQHRRGLVVFHALHAQKPYGQGLVKVERDPLDDDRIEFYTRQRVYEQGCHGTILAMAIGDAAVHTGAALPGGSGCEPLPPIYCVGSFCDFNGKSTRKSAFDTYFWWFRGAFSTLKGSCVFSQTRYPRGPVLQHLALRLSGFSGLIRGASSDRFVIWGAA